MIDYFSHDDDVYRWGYINIMKSVCDVKLVLIENIFTTHTQAGGRSAAVGHADVASEQENALYQSFNNKNASILRPPVNVIIL